MNKIKAWIVYGGSPEWWDASLILENGFVMAGHICSHPYYMKGDLIEHRAERGEALRRMGYEVEVQGEPIAGSDNAPSFLIEANKNEEGYKEFSEKYFALLKEVEETK